MQAPLERAIEWLGPHCDLETRVREVPPAARARGVYMRSVMATLEQQGKLAEYVYPLDLPGLDGLAFHAWLQRERPALARRLVLTGDASDPRYADALEQRGLPVLTKPLDAEGLRASIAAAGAD